MRCTIASGRGAMTGSVAVGRSSFRSKEQGIGIVIELWGGKSTLVDSSSAAPSRGENDFSL